MCQVDVGDGADPAIFVAPIAELAFDRRHPIARAVADYRRRLAQAHVASRSRRHRGPLDDRLFRRLLSHSAGLFLQLLAQVEARLDDQARSGRLWGRIRSASGKRPVALTNALRFRVVRRHAEHASVYSWVMPKFFAYRPDAADLEKIMKRHSSKLRPAFDFVAEQNLAEKLLAEQATAHGVTVVGEPTRLIYVGEGGSISMPPATETTFQKEAAALSCWTAIRAKSWRSPRPPTRQ